MAEILPEIASDVMTSDGSALTDEQRLAALKLVRSRIVYDLATGKYEIREYWISNRRAVRNDLVAYLKALDELIEKLESQLTAHLPRRNYARVVRTT